MGYNFCREFINYNVNGLCICAMPTSNVLQVVSLLTTFFSLIACTSVSVTIMCHVAALAGNKVTMCFPDGDEMASLLSFRAATTWLYFISYIM